MTPVNTPPRLAARNSEQAKNNGEDAMRRLAAALAVATALALGHDAVAMPLIDLSTGVGAGGLLAFGSPDDQWTVVGAPVGAPLGTATVVPPSRGYFADLEPDARWISATPLTNVDAPWGYYTYETAFVLDLSRVQGGSHPRRLRDGQSPH